MEKRSLGSTSSGADKRFDAAERKGGKQTDINDKSDTTTYEGGGGDDSRRCDFKAVGLGFEARVADPVPEAN